ncbi:MAG: ABC transporter ATP-binding protein [Acidobacteriota bacterium]
MTTEKSATTEISAPAEKSAPAIEVEGLKKSFGKLVVLGGINLKVPQGGTLAVLGRSGTGKSVLLKLIIGLQKPDAGSIRIDGEEITGLKLDQLNKLRKRMGFSFQYSALYDSLSVEENVAFPLRRHSDLKGSQRKERVRELLEQVGMDGALTKLPSEISGGMKKRVGLARALALEPEIMLFDEPTAGLDPITAGEINELILELQRRHKMSSIVVTHDMHSAKAVSDRVMLLDQGQIRIEGSFEDLQKSEDPFVVDFLKHSF